jgi:hypothetical protein
MANPEHVKLVNHGTAAIDLWRDRYPGMRLDLRESTFNETDLIRANLSGADLRGAYLVAPNLREANCVGADLSMANLISADLREANLREANLSGANLIGADLSRVNLVRSNLSGANVRNANFREAYCAETVFGDVDLSEAIKLDTIYHRSPSIISVDTLYNSRGRIPEAFLRGCGVPDNLIKYLPSLIGSMAAIQFYSCFISYSSKDEEFCKRLHSRLLQDHVRVWLASEDMKGGQKIHEQLDAAIRLHDKLLLVVSEHSMNSEWVRTEIRKARKRELKEGRRVLFPIRLVPFERLREWEAFDADTGKDMAVEVREYFVPDFTTWKVHARFEAEYKKLLRDLQASAEKPK